jgi:hypothetical protein
MPALHCSKCGRITNSAVAECVPAEFREGGAASGCYAAVQDGVWVAGCLYDEKNRDFTTTFARKYIGTSAIRRQPESPHDIEC